MNVADDELGTAVRVVESAASPARPFAATIGPVATFAPERPVVYLAVTGADGELDALRAAAGSGPLAPPPSRPERPFVPHVTLSSHAGDDLARACLVALGRFERETVFTHLHLLEQDLALPERPWLRVAAPALGGTSVRGRGGLEVELAVAAHLDLESAAWVDSRWAEHGRAAYGPRWRRDEPFAVVARSRPPRGAGGLVGVATGEIRGGTCELSRLLVGAEARGEGVGSRLLEHVERLASEKGCDRVRLRTAEGGPAEGFYARRGYAREALLPRWREGRDFVVMSRPLRPGP